MGEKGSDPIKIFPVRFIGSGESFSFVVVTILETNNKLHVIRNPCQEK